MLQAIIFIIFKYGISKTSIWNNGESRHLYIVKTYDIEDIACKGTTVICEKLLFQLHKYISHMWFTHSNSYRDEFWCVGRHITNLGYYVLENYMKI